LPVEPKGGDRGGGEIGLLAGRNGERRQKSAKTNYYK